MKRISTCSIIAIIFYFISVMLFLITKTDLALTIWELMTIIGGLVYLTLFVKLSEKISSDSIYKKLISIFAASGVVLTSVAHIVNIAVTRRLIGNGIDVPNYFRIGYFPSVEMAVDYLGWGLFIGLAFLCISISIKNKKYNSIKRTCLLSSMLCLIGFIGALFINENMWYIATIGYGIIPIYLCIKTMKVE